MTGGKASRAKGKAGSRAVTRWLQQNGHPFCAERSVGEDGDDIIGVPGLSIEVKNCARMELAAWIDQSNTQKQGRPGAVIHKRKGTTDVGKWYVTLEVADLFQLIAP